MQKESRTIKLMMLGDASVGKTSMLNYYMLGHCFNTNSTIGVDFRQKTLSINSCNVNLLLYDTAGQERFHNITCNYVRKVDGAIIVFDLTNKETFENLEKWTEEINELKSKDEFPLFFAGNKSDDLEDIEVFEKEIKVKLNNIYKGGKYFEVSAKTGNGINEMFENVLKDMMTNEEGIEKETFKLDMRQKTQHLSNGCC